MTGRTMDNIKYYSDSNCNNNIFLMGITIDDDITVSVI
jgi:hypothetical protein